MGLILADLILGVVLVVWLGWIKAAAILIVLSFLFNLIPSD